MAKKISVTLRKGGVGKTTTTVNLAAGLHQLGKKVLLIDLDPQANATVAVGVDYMKLDKTINTLFTNISIASKDVITQTEFGMDIMPSHPELANTEMQLTAPQVGFLKPIIDPLDGEYEYIIIDTPPAESYLSLGALVVSDEVIIPLQAHYLALHGLQKALEDIRNVQTGLNQNLKIAGILPTMVASNTNVGKAVIDEVKNNYPDLLLPIQIGASIRHSESTMIGKPLVLYDPSHPGAQAYMDLARYVTGEIINHTTIPYEPSTEHTSEQITPQTT